jgi:hypothetical protein
MPAMAMAIAAVVGVMSFAWRLNQLPKKQHHKHISKAVKRSQHLVSNMRPLPWAACRWILRFRFRSRSCVQATCLTALDNP